VLTRQGRVYRPVVGIYYENGAHHIAVDRLYGVLSSLVTSYDDAALTSGSRNLIPATSARVVV
jgi:hypothetical protein